MKISFDQSRLSAQDIIDFQRETGIAFSDGTKRVDDAMSGQGPLDEGAARSLAGIIWIAKRKDDPEFTYQDALQIEAGQIERDDSGEDTVSPLEDGQQNLLESEQSDLS